MLLTHSDSRSPGAEWLTSPRLRMPTIRLLLLITGNLRTFSASIWRTALARSSSSRQQWMPSVITSRAVARPASKLLLASPLQTMSRSVTIPTNRSSSPIGMQPVSCSRINFASSVTGVLGLTQSTPLCITSLTFMADLRSWSFRCTAVQPPFFSTNLRRVVGLLAVEAALQGVEVPLRRAWALVEAGAADVALDLLDHGGRELFSRLSRPHRVELNLCRAFDVVKPVIGIGHRCAHGGDAVVGHEQHGL